METRRTVSVVLLVDCAKHEVVVTSESDGSCLMAFSFHLKVSPCAGAIPT